MEHANYPETNDNRLLSFSLQRPVLTMLVLFVLALFVKVLDTLVFRFDEMLGEAILTKSLGFLLVLLLQPHAQRQSAGQDTMGEPCAVGALGDAAFELSLRRAGWGGLVVQREGSLLGAGCDRA